MRLKYSFMIATSFTVLFFGLPRLLSAQRDDKCIQIFYDSQRDARTVQKYLQGFPEYRQVMASIENYENGDVEKCQATFYVNSREEGMVPRSFAEDYVRTSRNVIWMGPNIWQLGERLERFLGLRYIGLISLAEMREGEILYKGRTFKGHHLSSKQVELMPVNSQKFEVLAGIRRRTSREVAPFVVRSQNRFFVAEVPVEEGGLSGRAQGVGSIFVDILSEMVGVPPQVRARSISSNSR